VAKYSLLTTPGSMKGLDKYLAKLDRLREVTLAPLREALNDGADQLVADMKAICPTSDLEPHPGALREAIHKQDGGTPLSVAIVDNAKDLKGDYYAAHVEFGHYAGARPKGVSHKRGDDQSGGRKHVAAKPFFFPSFHRARKKFRAKISRAMTKGVKAAMQ
jgi:hypothetical protein